MFDAAYIRDSRFSEITVLIPVTLYSDYAAWVGVKLLSLLPFSGYTPTRRVARTVSLIVPLSLGFAFGWFIL